MVKQQIIHNYKYVSLYFNNVKKTLRVHRLVALAFIPNPNNLPCINHIDENKLNNCVENLEWCDAHYNNTYGNRMKIIKEKNTNHQSLSIPIRQIDKTTKELINIFPSAREAMRYLLTINKNLSSSSVCTNICLCCKGKRKNAYGYMWKYD